MRTMATPRDVLNELKWRYGALEEARICYRHRGAPLDEAWVKGERVRDLGKSFMELEGPMGGTMLPYHRVLRIELDGELVWRRRSEASAGEEE